MMRKTILFFALLLCATAAPAKMQPEEYAKLKERVDGYLERVTRQKDWLVSRLQMYWTTHATDVFVNGETFDHPGGGRAPVPTVKFNGTRSHGSQYDQPKLEDVVPYDDDEAGSVTYVNRATGVKERTHTAKTGCNVASLNRKILGIARDAAKLYAENGDTRYARMALDVFDTYMKGIYYRNVPTDLTHGHMQTLVGLTTFEVIHEDAINELTEMYPLLKPFIRKDKPLYEAALKKWAENIIANGVPQNNWDLIQANFIVRIALVLQEDSAYADRRGRGYYIDYVINRSSIRQWSMKRLADYGFDPQTHIWGESPGYSVGVVKDYAEFANTVDKHAGVDMFREIPAIEKSIFAMPQYLFPNRMICGFGDTHPNYLQTTAIDRMADYARRHGDQSLLQRLAALRKAIQPDAPAADISKYVSHTFYSPNVSWVMLRTGMDARHDLAVSVNGALGNHMHANGINMELYGKGFVLGPDAGIGRVLYSGADYNEYYSRFPAHNTVCVDGVSDHAVMTAQHAFEVQMLQGTAQASVSQVAFIEPETQSDQLRTNGIVKTGKGGYYVDIFRSRRKNGKDKFHDYFYHNLGQAMTLTAADGADLNLQPTDELAFAGGHLYAYSYIYDKRSATTDRDVKATFTTTCPDGRKIDMTLWMQGSRNREVFRALSPVNLEYERLPKFMPYNVAEQPVLTYVARQHGDAWSRPFVAVFEPSDSNEPSEIERVEFFTPEGKDAVGIKVTLKNGRTDIIVSTPSRYEVTSDGQTTMTATR